jgi:hypothetical protein
LSCLIRFDLAAAVLKVESNGLARPAVGSVRSFPAALVHKTNHLGDLAGVIEPNIFRIVPERFDEFGALAHTDDTISGINRI